MRPAITAGAHGAPGPQAPRTRKDSEILARLLPYLWTYKWRVAVALGFMVAAKLANVGVPLVLKELIDAMTLKPGDPLAVVAVPAAARPTDRPA